jgi:hypothetical protein
VGKEMLKALNKMGVEAIEPLGQPFDPNFHMAIQQAESNEYPEGTVSLKHRNIGIRIDPSPHQSNIGTGVSPGIIRCRIVL